MRMLYQLEKLEGTREKKLFEEGIIGRLSNRQRDVASELIDASKRKSKYRWQRSKKIGIRLTK